MRSLFLGVLQEKVDFSEDNDDYNDEDNGEVFTMPPNSSLSRVIKLYLFNT